MRQARPGSTLGGKASGEHLWQVLAELQLDDDEVAGRIVAKLEGLGFGAISEPQRDSQLKKLDGQIAETREAAANAP